ncbi:hypothetical protein O6H91_Y442300 [Diphasiastrum complanatum]|nr:hypothetical protein O6H91_Y442300 [Diphasiastrum complanatum]
MDDDEGGEEDRIKFSGAVTHHLPKRVRRDKSAVIIFDETARRDFVTGFHKRKKQRRKVAEMQKKVKERQKRLKERKEVYMFFSLVAILNFKKHWMLLLLNLS